MALGLGSANGPARDLEGIGVVAHDGQLMLAAQSDARDHVEVAAHVAAGVLVGVLVLVHLQDDGAPGGVEDEVREGAGRLRLEAASSEGQVVLVLELNARLGQELVHFQLLALGQAFGIVAMEGTHVRHEPGRRRKLHNRLAEIASPVVALAAVGFSSPVRAEASAVTVAAIQPAPPVLAEAAAAAVATVVLLPPVLADAGRRRSRGRATFAARARRSCCCKRGSDAYAARARRSCCRRTRGSCAFAACAGRCRRRRSQGRDAFAARAGTSCGWCVSPWWLLW